MFVEKQENIKITVGTELSLTSQNYIFNFCSQQIAKTLWCPQLFAGYPPLKYLLGKVLKELREP